ncbi:MAG: flagellar hook-associated protein FlgK [Acidobacteria bacterium]|nr:flagellar hook-associated protein FlgK [Acidobacteriota bacterium]
MSNLLASLLSSAGTLEAYGRVLETAQNNVSNASTPGYAKQRMGLDAMAFDPASGATGGVRAGELQNSRNEYAEASVRQQTSGSGHQDQLVNSLTSIQSLFDISGNSGIPLALNNLMQAFSSWATTPGNQSVRQTVLDGASQLAGAFQQSYNALANKATDTDQQIHDTVNEINRRVAEIQNYNQIALQGNKDDSGLNARMHASLEELSQYVSFNATFQSDGTVSIMLNGQTPLLLEDKQYQLSAALYSPADATYPSAPAAMRIQAYDGSDITAATTGGQLGALLSVRNQTLASYLGDAYQPGSLNQLAKQIASRANELLSNGQISAGPPAVPGVPLFTYDTTNDAGVAQSLAVDTSVTTDSLAAIDPGPPSVSNGVPLALAQLANPLSDADKIGGVSYSTFYGQLAAKVGGQLNEAANGQQVQQSLLSQAKSLRDQYSGVSLDEEATILVQFQRAYQATSRFITVLNQLTQEAINILQ